MLSGLIPLVMHPINYLKSPFYYGNLYCTTVFYQYLLYQFQLNTSVLKQILIDTFFIKYHNFSSILHNVKKEKTKVFKLIFCFMIFFFGLLSVFIYLLQIYFDILFFHIIFLCFFLCLIIPTSLSCFFF